MNKYIENFLAQLKKYPYEYFVKEKNNIAVEKITTGMIDDYFVYQMNNTYIYFHTVGLGSSDRIKNNFIRSTMLNQHFLLGGFYCTAT